MVFSGSLTPKLCASFLSMCIRAFFWGEGCSCHQTLTGIPDTRKIKKDTARPVYPFSSLLLAPGMKAYQPLVAFSPPRVHLGGLCPIANATPPPSFPPGGWWPSARVQAALPPRDLSQLPAA